MDITTERQPTFSIVIPTYNRAKELKNCLAALKIQTFSDFEVLICDDGSTDETAEVINRFVGEGLKIRHFYNENWGGPARPRNIGIREAKADWICFLDSDDIWYPKKLEYCAQFLDGNDLIYHDLYLYDGRQHGRRVRSRQLPLRSFEDLMINGNAIATSSVCVRKQVLVAAGSFSEEKELIALEDFDLWLRLARRNIKFRHLNVPLGSYWIEGEVHKITEKSLKQVKRIEALYARHIPVLSQKERQLAFAMRDFLIARVYDGMCDYKQSITLHKQVIMNAALRIKFKSFIFLLIAYVKRVRK
jgi:glycosyltransferase involved in cell wall biosynthesis